jgi:hypothetical protein
VCDEYLTEFMVTRNGNKNLLKDKLDPDEIGFSQPDFGYNYDLDFDQEKDPQIDGGGWSRFMDCVSLTPRYERVRNYIEFVNQKKI